MPRAPRTKLILKRERIKDEIKRLQLLLSIKEGELEEITDLIQLRGHSYLDTPKRHGRARTQANAFTGMFNEPVRQLNTHNNKFYWGNNA